MSPDETGRFCSSCNKTVVDFTNLSDEEVLAIMQRSTAKVCGRFQVSQLQRPLYQQKRHQNMLLPAVLISSALVAGEASGAGARPEMVTVVKNDTLPVIARKVSDTISARKDTMPEFSLIGFKIEKIKLSNIDNPQKIEAIMQPGNYLAAECLQGVLGGVVAYRPTLWQRIKRLFR
jgi:hypothetical protein